ncbi:MAG: phosphoribosylamine--glycine ligase [Planctomycetes bacterium]|nr:phosphoribosylamine--glycine ligase [Planctomycetota bacterium]
MPSHLSCPEHGNVLLIGGGGREHALAWKLCQSPRLGDLWLANPGNAALDKLGKPCPRAMDMSDVWQMQHWCEQNDIHLVVVGPEVPLAKGIVDALTTETRMVFGPNKNAAQIEANKAFARELMKQVAIPKAEGRTFKDLQPARHYVDAHEEPCVVKASGLAAGKGVIVCDTRDQAMDAVNRIMANREFGDAGKHIIIEEKLSGQEVSVLALVDGSSIWLLDPCQDHKQLGEGDTGPNTGGMGAYCPTPILDHETMAIIQREIIVPTVDALKREAIQYCGVLYAGIMLTPAGPKVLEFNCRFGDPECQTLMARLKGDLFEILWATCTGDLDNINIEFDPRTACCVVMCSEGYPGKYQTGKVITGIEEAEAMGSDDEIVKVFHAGTKIRDDGALVTNGGRVLGVTALAADLQAARDLANVACEQIHFDGAFYRRDIGDRVLVTS